MDRRNCGQSFSGASANSATASCDAGGICTHTSLRTHVLQTGSRSRSSKARRKFGQSSQLWRNQSRARFELAGCRCTPRRQSGMIQKRPTKLWSETYGALPLSYSATHLGLRWWDSNPRPPAYKACTPSRQSVLYHWPCDEVVVRRIALPLSYTHHQVTGWMIGLEPTTAVLQPAVAAAKVTFQKRQPTRKMVQTRHCEDVVQTGSWRSETPVGIEPTSNRVAAGCLAIGRQRQVSSSGVEPDPRPSQGRVRSATLRGYDEGRGMRGE